MSADPTLIGLVGKWAQGTETYQLVATLRTYRRHQRANPLEVTVQVWDSGLPGDYRWLVEARGENGGFASGNGAPDLESAFATTHWNKLDDGPD